MFRTVLWLPLVVGACSAAERLATGACGDLGPRGDTRAQLAVLDCLTAVAAGDPGRKQALTAQIERGFRHAYTDLLRKPMLEDALAEWTELYRLWSRFYPRQETLDGRDGVPITFVNSHHFSVPFWIRRSQETPLGTLLHFDTHSDMEAIPRMDDVRRAVEDIRARRNLRKAWHVVAHAVFRNSMPVSAAVLTAGVQEVVWAKPSWARDPVDFFARSFFYARARGMADTRPLEQLEAAGPHAFASAFRNQLSDFFQLYYDPVDNGGSWLPRREQELETWALVGPQERPQEKAFEGIHRIRLSVLTTDEGGPGAALLPRAVSGERFVLDIDLDYFVNQGSDVAVTDDPPSFGQRVLRREDQPESGNAIYHQRRIHAAYLSAEREVIERRIRHFRKLLLDLRAAGKRPSIVSIADSAHLPFTAAREGQERAEFVPPHHVYWVHDRVVSVIREVFAGGPKAAEDGPLGPERPPSPRRKTAPVFGPEHPASLLARRPVRDALASAVVWATGAATTHHKAPHLSAYFLILHAVATHGPVPSLRRAAREAAALHAGVLDGDQLGPPYTPSAAEAEESLRRIRFAQRYGSREAEVALGAARWAARAAGLAGEPDIDADVEPLKPSEALEKLGLLRVARGLDEANLADVFTSQQATDGGFGSADMPPLDRAAFTLLAVRGLLGLLPTAELKPEPDAPLAPGFPVSRRDVNRAVLRGTLFAIARLGELPSTEDAIDGLLLYRTVRRVAGNAPARLVARSAGSLLAGRIAVKLPLMIAAAREPDQLVAFAELGLALRDFGVDVKGLRAAVAERLARHRPGAILGFDSEPPSYADAFVGLSRSYVLAEFGIPGFSYERALRRALPLTARASFVVDPNALVDRFNAVSHLLVGASGGRRLTLDRDRYRGEWRFLESVFVEVMASRRPDMVSALLESRRILGETAESPRFRDLVWALVHEQNIDGSWGRPLPEDVRLRATWAAVSALADFIPGEPTALSRIAERVVAERPREPPPPETDLAAVRSYKPGTLMGTGRPRKGRGPRPGFLRARRR